jgi:hypothetical protein
MVVNKSEKDRLGDKLREAERGREDQYFAERDRELLERLRREQQAGAEGTSKEEARGRCPKCGTSLQPRSLHGVSVDACPACRGMWLDEGELQELARREDEGWIARWLRSEFRPPE